MQPLRGPRSDDVDGEGIDGDVLRGGAEGVKGEKIAKHPPMIDGVGHKQRQQVTPMSTWQVMNHARNPIG